MKKKLLALTLALVSVFACLALTACGNEPLIKVVSDGECVAFTAKSSVITFTDTTSVKDYMDALVEKGELKYEGYNGEYGFYITSVEGKKEETGYFWSLYTDLVTIEGDSAVYSSAEWGIYDLDGKTLNAASYGVSNLPCVEGYTYALVYSSYSY